jgi:hypothetical protein
MKKFFMAIMFCLVCVMCFSQKTFSSENFVVETTDEFGEKTGRIKVGISADGYFSNSATTNSCANLYISLMAENSWYDLYEYCSNHSSDEMFNVTFIGTNTKDTIIDKNGDLDNLTKIKFLNLCKENDTINIKMRSNDKYSSTRAVFRLFNCKDFYQKYIKEFGELPELPKDITISNLYGTSDTPVTISNLYGKSYISVYKYDVGYGFLMKDYITTDKTEYTIQFNKSGRYKIKVHSHQNKEFILVISTESNI